MRVLDPAALARCSRWLLTEAAPGDWTLAAVDGVVAVAPVLATAADGESHGLRVVPFGEGEARFSGGRGCRELVLPVVVLPAQERTAPALAASFPGHRSGARGGAGTRYQPGQPRPHRTMVRQLPRLGCAVPAVAPA